MMNLAQILDLIKRNTNAQNVTLGSYPIAAQIIDINNALNWYFIIANKGSGNWRPADDTNQPDYPIIVGNIVTGQQDYVFTVDQNGNQILNIYKVQVLNPDGITWNTLTQLNQDAVEDQFLNPTSTGIPDSYYITANGIFLVNPSNYTLESALKIYIARTGTYFSSSDLTKVAGIPWIFAEYLALRPSYFYCLQKGLPQAASYKLSLYGPDGKGGMEEANKEYYRDRNHDFSSVITSVSVDAR